MKANNVLFINSEMVPFVGDSPRAIRGRKLPQAIQEKGHEIRTFMPKWGGINERRNQLHEVIRLSGMNIVIDDTDHQLIIKVASIQAARMQIYFIDNDDFFRKKGMTCDLKGKEYNDLGERAVFFARGVLETVKKLNWIPNVIHCTGWATALAPLFIKKAYQDEPSFSDAKIVFSATAHEFEKEMKKRFFDALPYKDITAEDVADICTSSCTFDDLMKIGVKFSDGVIFEDNDVSDNVKEYAKSLGKPILDCQSDETYIDAYNDFYETVMG